MKKIKSQKPKIIEEMKRDVRYFKNKIKHLETDMPQLVEVIRQYKKQLSLLEQQLTIYTKNS